MKQISEFWLNVYNVNVKFIYCAIVNLFLYVCIYLNGSFLVKKIIIKHL